MEEEEEEDQREMARTKGTKRMEPSAATNQSHLRIQDTRYTLADRRIDDLVTNMDINTYTYTIKGRYRL